MRSLSPTWLVLAAVVLSLILQISDGFYHVGALTGLSVVLVLGVLGVAGVPWPWVARGGAADDPDARAVLASVLGIGVVVSALLLVTSPVARYMADPRPWAHRSFLVVVAAMAAAATVGSLAPRGWPRKTVAVVLLAGGLWLGTWTIQQSPNPHIDVIPVHTDAFEALGRGVSPYGITFDDMYAPDESFYVPEMRKDGRVLFGFPYPPLSLMLAWPGHALLGDLRYSEVFALTLTAGLLILLRRDGIGILLAGVLLLAPRLPFHIEQGWTEPFPILLIATTVAVARWWPSLVWLPLGLLVASKQHMVIAFLFAPWLIPGATGRDVVRLYAAAAVTGLLVTLPLALMDPDAFYRSAILLQLREPFRLDSLSFARLFVAEGWALDKQGAVFVSLGAGLVAAGLAWWRAPRSPAGFAAALALTCLFVTAFGKKAFLNYYMLVVAALLTAVAAHAAPTARLREPASVGHDASCSRDVS